MFQELSPDVKSLIVDSGEIEFLPSVKWPPSASGVSYTKHLVIFLNKSGKQDEMGAFYLTCSRGFFYNITKLEITAKCGDGLKLFIYELICKKAIADAVSYNAFCVNIESEDTFIVDAFLTCQFNVRRTSRSLTDVPLFHGFRNLPKR